MALKYSNVTLSIVEEKNSKAFGIASLLALIGIVVLILSIVLFKVGTIRTSGIIVSLALIVSPFALRFFIDQYKKIGVLRLEENGILVKYNNQEAISYSKDLLENLSAEIKDFEGETKVTDLKRGASTINVRSGEENKISWTCKEENYCIQFKLENEVQKVKALYLIKYLTN